MYNIYAYAHTFSPLYIVFAPNLKCIFMAPNNKLLFSAFLLFLSLIIFSLSQPMQEEEALAPRHDQNNNKQAFHVTNDHDHVKEKMKGQYRRRKWLPFSQMMPKGYVPPSGSSACHNDMPDSVTVDLVCQDEFSSP